MRISKSAVLGLVASFASTLVSPAFASGSIRGGSSLLSLEAEDDDGWEDLPPLSLLGLDEKADDLAAIHGLEEVMLGSSGWHRFLQENGTFRPPNSQELADLLVMEINNEVGANGTADPLLAFAKIAEEVLAQANKTGDLDPDNMDNITDTLDLPDGSPELDQVNVAAVKGTNHSVCLIPGHCSDQQHLEMVRDVIRKMLNEHIVRGEEPDIQKVYRVLDEQYGMNEKLADQLIEGSPSIRKYLKSKVQKSERVCQKKQLSPLTDQLEKQLMDAAHNKTDLDEALAQMNMEEDELANLLAAMGPNRSSIVLNAIEKPKEDLKNQVDRAYTKHAIDNHTYFEETEEEDFTPGRRMLRFKRHPTKKSMSIEDHIQAIDRRIHHRRLSKKALPKHTLDFEQSLRDHIQNIQGHVRELQASCDRGGSSLRCSADSLGGMADDLGSMGDKVTQQLGPLSKLLGDLSSGQDAMDTADRIASTVFSAVGIASSIPGQVGTIFEIVKKGMKPINNILDSVDEKATQFENSVGKIWQNSVGRVEGVIESFDSSMIAYVVQGAAMAATVKESQCLTSMVNELTSANLIGGMERAVGIIKTYMETLHGALSALLKSLSATAWQTIAGTLQSIVDAVAPVQRFFDPFKSLADLLTDEIVIDPWFKLPYAIKHLGGNRCDSGYSKGTIDKRTCFENNSREWEYHLLPNRMMTTCAAGGLQTHWSGKCRNKGKPRRKTHLRPPRCRCSCRWWCCPRCSSPSCPGGYSWAYWDPMRCAKHCDRGYTANLNTCYKSNCPSGFSNTYGRSLCTKSRRRKQKWRPTKCNYRLEAGTTSKQDIFGNCWQSCKQGHTEILGACFAPAVLRLSVQDIFDAFQAVMDFISGLPIVKQILDAIDLLVSGILKPVMDKVDDWLKNALSLPDFPTINVDLLPLDVFDDLSLPSLPDLSLTDLPVKFANQMLDYVPPPLNSLWECNQDNGPDVDCVLRKFGMGDLSSMFNGAYDMVEQIGDSMGQFQDVVSNIKCKTWGKKMVPVSDVLAQVGLPDINACDIELDYCEELDLNGAGAAMAILEDKLQPVLDHFLSTPAGRRLSESEGDGYLPWVGVKGELGEISDQWKREKFFLFGGQSNDKVDPVTGKGWRKEQIQPMGVFAKGEIAFNIGIGQVSRNGKKRVGLDFGVEGQLRFSRAGGPLALLDKGIETLQSLEELTEQDVDTYDHCSTPQKKLTNSAQCQDLDDIFTDKNRAFSDSNRVPLEYFPGQITDCTEVGMNEIYDNLEKLYRDIPNIIEQRRNSMVVRKEAEAFSCIQYWLARNKLVEDGKSEFKESTETLPHPAWSWGTWAASNFWKSLYINSKWFTFSSLEGNAAWAHGNSNFLDSEDWGDLVSVGLQGILLHEIGPVGYFKTDRSFKEADLGKIMIADFIDASSEALENPFKANKDKRTALTKSIRDKKAGLVIKRDAAQEALKTAKENVLQADAAKKFWEAGKDARERRAELEAQKLKLEQNEKDEEEIRRAIMEAEKDQESYMADLTEKNPYRAQQALSRIVQKLQELRLEQTLNANEVDYWQKRVRAAEQLDEDLQRISDNQEQLDMVRQQSVVEAKDNKQKVEEAQAKLTSAERELEAVEKELAIKEKSLMTSERQRGEGWWERMWRRFLNSEKGFKVILKWEGTIDFPCWWEDCSDAVRCSEEDSCQNGGTCVDGHYKDTCTCAPGFKGTNCEINVDECKNSPCLNGGTCVDGDNDYTCECLEGFKGDKCEIVGDTDECESKPCLNDATCKDGDNTYTCTCARGFEGDNCETNIDDCVGNPCENEGTCLDGIEEYTCACKPGFEGNNCEINIDECAGKPCKNGGTCRDGINDYTCDCPFEFLGKDCQTRNHCAATSNPCKNGGQCQNNPSGYTCSCADGWTGRNCGAPVGDAS